MNPKPLNLALSAAALIFISHMAAFAEGPTRVKSLRTEKVPLYAAPNGAKAQDYPRANFKEPWKVLQSKDGFLQVEVDGQTSWVRAYSVETDAQVHANKECNAAVTGREPKAGVTRGIGEGCAGEKKK